MEDADVLVTKIKKWVDLQKKCAEKLNYLADELEDAVKAANVTKVFGSSVSAEGAAAMTAAGVLTVLSGRAALPVLATFGAVGALASGTSIATSVGSEAYSASKSKDIMEQAQKCLDELQSLEQEIKDLMKSLKVKPSSSCDGDDDDCDVQIMEIFLKSEARQYGMNLSHVLMIRQVCGLQKIHISRRIMTNEVMFAASAKGLIQALILAAKEGGKKVASSLGKKATSVAAGCIAGGVVGLVFSVPELVSDCQNLDNNETQTSKTLRENARAVLTNAEETEEELQKIREALRRLARIRSIIKTENRSHDEERDLIEYAIQNSPDPVVKQWLREYAESGVFFNLVNVGHLIEQMLNQEAAKKKDCDLKKIELIFLAHGEIGNWMIPARCLLPLTSITDVLLYSPWNCILFAEAAYSIAVGTIQPWHRLFGCTSVMCSLPSEAHTTFNLPSNWNSMRNTDINLVPNIMVSPVGKLGDVAFERFVALTAAHGAPADNRYLIAYLAPSIDRVPLFVVNLTLSLALFFEGYEANVHLAACLEKFPKNAVMQEEYLKLQYAYTVDNTGMNVQIETFSPRPPSVDNMFKAVFRNIPFTG